MNRPKPRALVVRTDRLGDAVLTTPLLHALADGGYEVDFMLPGALVPLFAPDTRIAACLPLDPAWERNGLRLARTLRRGRYDVLLLPNGRPWRLHLAALLSGIPRRLALWGGVAGRLLGTTCLRSGLLENPRHYADILLDLARRLGLAVPDAVPRLSVAAGEKGSGRRRIGIHAGSGGTACHPAPAFYGEVAALLLAETDWEIVLTGSAAEEARTKEWPAAVLDSPRVRKTFGRFSLVELAAEIGALDLLVVGGTGPLHIAAAMGTATLSPFCRRVGISPEVWGNRNGKGRVVQPKPEQCLGVPSSAHCDFAGKLTVRQFVDEAKRMLS